MRRLQIKPCFPLLGLAVGLALIMPGCSSKPSNSYEGYVEGKFVYVASPQGGRLTHLSVSRGETVYEIAAQRFNAGGISQLALLDAQRQHLQTLLDRTASAAIRYTDSASLFQALGGGWWNGTQASAVISTPLRKRTDSN